MATEMRRAVHRAPGLTQQTVSELLEGVSLCELTPSLFQEAGLLPGAGLRSLDALNLVAATRIGVDGLLTFDERMADAARELGSRSSQGLDRMTAEETRRPMAE